MDELNKIIAESRHLFDSEEPGDGHFDKFAALLAAEPKKLKARSWIRVVKVASICLMVMLSSLYVAEHLFELGQSMPVYENSEYGEAKRFYMHQVNYQLNQIEQMDAFLNDEQRALLVEEMTEMDAMYKKLQQDLKARPDDQRVIDALINHYQMKTDILNRIVNDLQNVKQNTQDHESVQI